MTIKQQGGVFGRNPTFNNVEADGKLTTLGRLGVGTVDPAYDVDIKSGAPSLVLRDTDANSGLHWLRVSNNKFIIGADFANSATNSDIWLQVDGGTKMVVASTGDVTVSTGNLVIGTSGKGIDFSATSGTGTSELFDDYEEGTWTPEITAATVGDLAVTYSVQTGLYTKIGRTVTAYASITTSSFTHLTASGIASVANLPFTVGQRGVGALVFEGITKIGFTSFLSVPNAGTTNAELYASRSGGTTSTVKITEMLSGGTVFLQFTVTYTV